MKTISVLAVLAAAGLATPALGHAFLQHAHPGAGETLAAAPKEIVLEFTEPLEAAFSGAEATDASGKDMESAHGLVSGKVVHIPLKVLAPGRYRVSWHAVSVDAHRTEGAYNFTVKP